jgi:signal transduction histidine kinase
MANAAMPPFITPNSSNKSIQFWIAVRLFQSLTFLASAFVYPETSGRWLSKKVLIISALLVSSLVFIGITFYPAYMPVTFIPGVGLTPFKRISEYLIILSLCLATVAYWRRMKRTGENQLIYYLAAFLICIFSELPFAVYTKAFDTYNILGHIYKVGAFFLIYYGIYRTSVKAPYLRLVEIGEELQGKGTELRKANEALRDLSSRLLSTQEEERKRIAGEIHDILGSSLSAVKFKIEYALQQIEKISNACTGSLKTVIPMVQDTIEECRRIQQDLRPPMLDQLGLLPTFSWFCRNFQSIYSHISVDREIGVEEEEIPENLKIVIYRITQEAMNNLAKYSQADQAHISLQKRDGHLEFVVQDNGIGFDTQKVFSLQNTRKGLGLTSMRERAELSGGSSSIESAEGKGTTIKVSWKI